MGRMDSLNSLKRMNSLNSLERMNSLESCAVWKADELRGSAGKLTSCVVQYVLFSVSEAGSPWCQYSVASTYQSVSAIKRPNSKGVRDATVSQRSVLASARCRASPVWEVGSGLAWVEDMCVTQGQGWLEERTSCPTMCLRETDTVTTFSKQPL